MVKVKKADLLLIGGVIAAAVLLLVFNLVKVYSNKAEQLKITVNGKVIGVYSLDTDREISIGEGNICEISNGEARMKWADCPDQYCVKALPIGKNSRTIVCLPNKVVLTADIEESAADMIAG